MPLTFLKTGETGAMKNSRVFFISALITGFILMMSSFSSASTFPEVTFILDGSGSMWGKAGDKTKIEAAKTVFSRIIPGLAPEVKTGLVAYGHRRKG
ncbi:MAG: VWA domain-containing protein, partial [Desulfatirhabdiaceae bacterium]